MKYALSLALFCGSLLCTTGCGNGAVEPSETIPPNEQLEQFNDAYGDAMKKDGEMK